MTGTKDKGVAVPMEQDSEFSRQLAINLGRRNFCAGTVAAGIGAFFSAAPISAAIAATSKPVSMVEGFKAVAASTEDRVIVPEGYQAEVLISRGDPIFPDAPEFDPAGSTSAAAQSRQFGDNTDGMSLFPIDESRVLLAVNNEYVNAGYMFAHKGKSMTAADVLTSQAAHGVSIFEIVRDGDSWKVDKSGLRNRRITANTPMQITGPAAAHERMKTAADPTGSLVLGTINNCANGETPWGTYLTCEENFHRYFGAGGDKKAPVSAEMKRYGIRAKNRRYDWTLFDERFNIRKNPNEPNRFGWVVEIDPMNPDAVPQKRTALGRFKHENAALVVNSDGHVVVYMGDDERGEHIYKFVSRDRYDASSPAANRNLLEAGTLYVAKFMFEAGKLEGKGEWLELTHGRNGLTPENGFADQAEVLIHARLAATQVGGTTMDRPEWVAVHPNHRAVFFFFFFFFCLFPVDEQPVDGVNPRRKNPYGHIVRWRPTGADHAGNEFDWDLFVIAGNPTLHDDLYGGSGNITADNMFNGPDGIGFDKSGRLWILTDGKYSNKGDFAGMGNNQMLCADCETGEIKRFLTGPVACEVTGLAFSPDQTTMFVGIQHPGENQKPSHFPGGGDSLPRSSIMMIRREDGGVIGA